MWMCSLCRLPVVKNHNCLANFDFWGFLYLSPLPMRVNFVVLKQTESLHLHAKFYLSMFIVSTSDGQKNTILGRFWHLGGSCTDPLLPTRAKFDVLKQTHSARLRVKIRLYRFILSPSGSEKPQFLQFFGCRHLVMWTIGSNLRKLNTGTQLQIFPYPTASKSFL